jgi:septum formation topological specificity factor MinE
MAEPRKQKEAFRFYTRLNLAELTGLKANKLGKLLKFIKEVPGSCIYHHTHRFLQQHQYLSPEPPNDFAYWVSEVLGEDALGEELASIDTIQFETIRSLREKIVETIEKYIKTNPDSKARFAKEGEEFYFIKSISFVCPSNYVASDLKEFLEILKKITVDSVYFHIFEARLRLEQGDNDFSNWIRTSLGNAGLAEKISRLDPYTYTLEELRKALIKIIQKYI